MFHLAFEPGFEGGITVEQQVEGVLDYVIICDLGVHLLGCELKIFPQFLVCCVEDLGVESDMVEAVNLEHRSL